jgi:serine/threonine protein kinase
VIESDKELSVEQGTVFADQYRLDERLGTGGMGEVWRGTDLRLDRPVAIKVVLTHLGTEYRLVERLLQEAKAAGALQHPGITVVHNIGEQDGRPFVVMELLAGDDLATLLERHPTGLAVDQVVSIADQVSDGLAAAHEKGIVHRDIKPANLILLPNGTVKICDFGVAKLADATTGLSHGSILGTPSYMSPEQIKGAELDGRTDLYSLGCTLYALLAGAPPFRTGQAPMAVAYQQLSEPPRAVLDVRPDTPRALAELVDRLLAKDPADRPADAATVRDSVRALRSAPQAVTPTSTEAVTELVAGNHQPIAPAKLLPHFQPAPPPDVPGGSRSRRRLATLVGVVAAIAVAATVMVVLNSPGTSDSNAGGTNPSAPNSPTVDPEPPNRIDTATEIHSMAFSPDGTTLASNGDGGAVQLWDRTTGRNTATLSDGGMEQVDALVFSPDGTTVASSGIGSEVQLWEVATGAKYATFPASMQNSSLAFSSDGQWLAIGGSNDDIQIWEIATGINIVTLHGGVADAHVTSLAFSPDGQRIVSANGSTTVRLWDVATGAVSYDLMHGAQIYTVAYSPDGKTIATCDGANIQLWDLAKERTTDSTLEGHSGAVLSLAFSPDGSTLASGGDDKTVQLWDVATGQGDNGAYGANTAAVSSVAFSPDGQTLAIGSEDKTIRFMQVD